MSRGVLPDYFCRELLMDQRLRRCRGGARSRFWCRATSSAILRHAAVIDWIRNRFQRIAPAAKRSTGETALASRKIIIEVAPNVAPDPNAAPDVLKNQT
jgi:hypothetical protein